MDVLPTGAVTFLFTDVEGSSLAWEERPKEMAADLKAHDEILRKAVEAHGGYLFAKGGDSISAAFASPSASLAAAITAQRGLNQAHSRLRVRMGVHTGEAIQRDGNYFGPALNRTARLMSLAHGGQVLVSSTTVDIVAPGEFSLTDLGEHRLKDMGKPIGVFQLSAEGLSIEFPPLHSALATNNLPIQGQIFGRDAAISQLVDMLSASRLVTLVGAGGIGKTTLAISAAHSALGSYADGCWLVDLTDLPAGSIDQLVAGAVGAAVTPLSRIESMASRQLLLLLDNCEHVLGGVTNYLGQLLRAAPQVAVLATSREPLGLGGEQVMRVPPLIVDSVSPEGDAVRLFAARAEQAGAVIDLEADSETVAAICSAVDGLPLAIELAAARTSAMTPTQVLDRLEDRLATLRGGRGGAVHRRTIEATIAWSYELLNPPTQAVFRRISIFHGGFTLDAAEQVCSADDITAVDVADAISDLVWKSLVQRDRDRFSTQESVGQFAASRLSPPEKQAVEKRHFEFFAGWAHDVYQDLLDRLTADEDAWIAADLHNLRSAITWGARHGDPERAAETAAVLWPQHVQSGSADPTDWVAPLLPHLDELAPALRMAVLHVSAYTASQAGDRDEALNKSRAEYEIFKEYGAIARLSPPHTNLGAYLSEEHRHEEAISIWEEALGVHRQHGFAGAIPACNIAAATLYWKGDAQAALEAIVSFEASQDPFARAYDSGFIDRTIADIYMAMGRPDDAWTRAQRSLATLRAHEVWPAVQVEAMGTMSEAALAGGDRELAIALLLESLDIGEGLIIEDEPFTGGLAYHVAELLIGLGAYQLADTVLDALEDFTELERPYPYFETRHSQLRRNIKAADGSTTMLPPARSVEQGQLRTLVQTALTRSHP